MNLGYEPEVLKIYLFGESVDMRKQMNGLIALVEGTYHHGSFREGAFPLHERKERQDQSTEKGYLQTDGYAGYNSVTKRQKDPAISVECWAHARRFFCDASKAIKKKQ